MQLDLDRALCLWMHGAFVGTWTTTAKGDILEYAESWLNSEEACPISLSLPLSSDTLVHRGSTVRFFFENLLPDSDEIRERLARRYGTKTTSAFDLLSEIGSDCVGALQILPVGAHPGEGIATREAAALSKAQVAQVLRDTTSAGPSTFARDLRVAIAGAQEKTALLYSEGGWWLPGGSASTTHILKLPMGLVGNMKLDLRESVENEWLCSVILRAYGLPVAQCEPLQFEHEAVLSVERFDRIKSESTEANQIRRRHQEDMCQALGVSSLVKYEADGGPGIDSILSLLNNAIDSARDKRTFFLAQVLFWMLCATDGHAKNFSLYMLSGGRYELTPLYDVLSAYPLLGEGEGKISPFKVKLAMAARSTNTHWKMRAIFRRHWIAIGDRHGVTTQGGRDTASLIDELVARTPHVLQSVRSQLPTGFPDRLADSILQGLERASQKLSV